MRFLRNFNWFLIGISVFFVLATVFVWWNFTREFSEPPEQNRRTSVAEPRIDLEPADVNFANSENADNTPEDGEESVDEIESETIEDSVLPMEKFLSVPFTSQAPEKNWDQPWQDACEEAAILMLDAFERGYNLSPIFSRDEIWKMVNWEEEKNWGGSIEAEKVKIILSDYFKHEKVKISFDPSVDDVKNILAKGKPVLALADGKVLPNPNFRNGGPVYHALVITGYNESGFFTNDPGTRLGEDFFYKTEDLMNALHDWNGGNVKEGVPVIIWLES